MDSGFMVSKRLLYASLFATMTVGGAVYFANSTQEVATKSTLEKQATTTAKSAGPSTETARQEVSASTEQRATSELTETDLLTRNVLKPYIEQSTDGSYSTSSKAAIIKNATREMFALEVEQKTSDDIQTTKIVTNTRALQYKEDLYKALAPIFTLTEYELTTYARAIKDNSREDFESLTHAATLYKSAGDATLGVIAPTDVSAVHLSLINSLYTFSAVLSALSTGYNDPAASLSGTGNFTKAEEQLSQTFNKFKTYFILKGITTP